MILPARDSALTSVKPIPSATKKLLETLGGSPLPLWAGFAHHVHVAKAAAGKALFHQGEAHPFVYVVRHGLIKNVYFCDDGEAWIKSFTSEGQFIASMAALKDGGHASFSSICVEDCELERIPFEAIEQLAARDLVWSNALRKAITMFAERKERRERNLLTLSAEDRYRALIDEQPDLERRASQKDLASYIGITPVGLNRIIKRLHT